MSSCFNRDWHARLGMMVALLALLACGTGRAQGVADDVPFETSASGRVYNGTTPLRLWHRTRGYGQEASDTAFGGRLAVDLADAVGFVDGQFRVSNESQFGMDLGGGFRWFSDGLLTGDPRILGVTGWYDGQETVLDNYFNQLGVSFESLGEFIDLRLNANIPLEDQKDGSNIIVTDDFNYVGYSLAQTTLLQTDVALRVVDFEAAARVFDLNAWVYGGGYQMDGEGISDLGAKGGVRGYVTNDLAVDVSVSDDDTFGTNTVFQIIWTPGRTGAGPTSWIHTLADRMREPVYRNTYIATDQVETTGSMLLTAADGGELRIVHVDSNATAPGDGTFENPYAAVDSVNGTGSQQGDIILVHSTSEFTGQAVILQDEQRFLGEGDNNNHTVVTAEVGEVTLPATSPGAIALARPIINDAPGSAVTLDGGNVEVETFSEIEVSNFTIDGGTNAVTSPTGVGDVNINRMVISNTTGNAIDLTPLTETLANNTMRSRFTPTIDDVTFMDIGGDDIQLTATTAQTTIVETIAISDIQSDDSDGVGIELIGVNRAATIANFDWDGGTTGEGALRIQNSGAQGDVTLSGTNPITGGNTALPNAEGFAVSLVTNAGDLTVSGTGTTITDMGGDSVIVNGGAGGMNFTGFIEQSENNASILSVSGGHTGSLTFTERVADAGVIQATIGDGLQFNNADGVYTFNDEVEFIGTSAAVTDIGGSDAVLTFANGQFTDTTGTTISFNGGEASMTFNGKITQTLNALVLSVTNGHDGTLVFNDLAANPGVISATSGDGLFFSNTDGAYTFNDQVTLNGGNAHIEILGTGDAANGSEGTFTFADADITNPSTDAAVIIDDSKAIFTYTGDIITTNSDAVILNANTGGSVTFAAASTITSSEGIDITANTGGTFLFAGQVTLDDTNLNANGVQIINNIGGSSQFNNIDIERSGTGQGFVASSVTAGHTVTVTGNDNNISTQTGVALNLNSIAAGAAGINFESISSNGAVNGIIINNVTGGTINVGANAAAAAGGTIQNSTGTAISITNAANVSLNQMVVNTTAATFDGVNINHSGTSTSTVSITNTQISSTGAQGIDYNRTASGTSRLTLVGNTINNTTDQGINIDINGTGVANVSITGNNQVDSTTGGDEALAITTSGGAGKTLNLLIDGSSFTNSSTDAAANIVANATGTVNATVTDNFFTNNDAATGRAYSMTTLAPGSTIRLNLNNNTGVNANATDEFLLTETAGDFRVEDLATVDARNTGTVQQVGTITDDPGPIPTP